MIWLTIVLSDCVFCEIVNGHIPAKIIAASDKSLAFLDVNPLTRGHSLIIPKKHYEKIQDVDDYTDLFKLFQNVVSKIDQLTGSTLVAIHNGKDSGQDVPHIHIHVIPRSKDDGAGSVHKMFKSLDIDDLDSIYKQLMS